MNTEGLRLFVIAAELRNISAAGRQLGLSPAVAGSRLANLETQLAAELLHRTTRKVSLSLEGAEFLPFAIEILAQEDAALAALGHGRNEVSGKLRFAASSSFVQLYIAPLLPEFLERYPHIDVELKLTDTQMDLIEGSFDLALRNYAIPDSNFHGRMLADDTRILCASPDYLSKHGTPLKPDDLSGHQLLTFMNSAPRALSSGGSVSTNTFPPEKARIRIVCDDGASMRIATIAGVGISMNSVWSVHDELRDGSLIRVLPEYEVDAQSAIWLVYPKSNVLTAKVRVFIDFMLEKFGNRPTWEADIPPR